jgi:CMP-N-acetylneuraminic acid synthetase
MEILGLILARGGSKSIEKKNLAMIEDIPLVVRSINHAKKSKINRIIVSTDDKQIADICKMNDVEVPFMRPSELAEDHILDWPVFVHALEHLKNVDNYIPDIIVHLRPTAPFRKEHWIDEAIELLINNPDADSVRSVSKPDKHPYRVFKIEKTGFLDPIMKHEHPEPYLVRRQDWPDMYFYNCVIDVTRPSTIFEKKSTTGDKILPYIIEPGDVLDIDSLREYEIAKLLIENKLISEKA